MIYRGLLVFILSIFTLLQSCSNPKKADVETTLKITNSEEFIAFVNDYNSGKFHINDSLIAPLTVNLDCDISIVNENIAPIGTEEFPFIGTFNGNGHTITCCEIGKSNRMDNVGLIGYAKNSTIKSVTVVTEKVSGQRCVGVICGYGYHTTISDCKASGEVNGEYCTGGIEGCASYGGISDCNFVGKVTASETLAGGIVGMIEFGGILRSYAGGKVSGKTGVNAISGSISEDVMVTDCADRMNVECTIKEKCQIKRDLAADKLTHLLFQM